MDRLVRIFNFIKDHWIKMMVTILTIAVIGIAITTSWFLTRKSAANGGVGITNNHPTIVTFDPGAPPVPGTGTGVATNSQPQSVPGQQPSPTGTPTATAVTINGDVRVRIENLAIAVGGGTAATSTIEKKWYDMPPTRYDKMLDDDGGRKVVGAHEDVVFTKPNGWYADPVIEDAREGTDFVAVKNKGTHESPDWVNAMNYRGNACELRIRSLRLPIKVRFALLPKE